LDGRDSVGLPGRPVQQYSWEIRTNPASSAPDFLLTAFGAVAQLSLPVGGYNVTLKVSDGTGLSSTASNTIIIGAGRSDGLIAVIQLPNSYVPAGPAGGMASVPLDAFGTQASPGNRLTQWVWAVISLPDKTPVTNTTGSTAVVSLPGGDYQVGLLAIDSAGDNAIAKKNFTVGGSSNGGPFIPPGLVVRGPSGGVAVIQGVVGPDNIPLTLQWTIDPDGRFATPGQGTVVNLSGIPPGEYTLAIIASINEGAMSSTARATLQVTPGTGAGARPGGGANLPSLRLPSLTLSQGSTVILDAGATGIPPADRNNYTYSWSLSQKASGNRVASSTDAVARFNLSDADTFQLQFRATEKRSGAAATATSNVRATPRQATQPPLPRVAAGSTCGPFTTPANGDTRLACPSLNVVDASNRPYTNTTFAWRVTNTKTGSVKTGIGKEFDVGK
jgi:hypothetical protein